MGVINWNRIEGNYMKKRLFLKCLALFLCGAFLVTIVGCSSQGSDKILSYSLTADPKNLDPQTANGADALLIIDNIFEGLYRKDAQGNLVLGAASSCEINEDGTEYRFVLPFDVTWKYYAPGNAVSEDQTITAKVTAHDFVYAFERLFDPQTNAPSASDYYCIKNAQAVKEGKLPPSELGVQALDDYTLMFTLSAPNPLFEELLAEPAAKPCNQEFFEGTTGRYGLSRETLLCNGPFYVSEWSNANDNDYVRIRKNDLYHDPDSVVSAGANLTVRSNDAAIASFEKGDIDSISLSADDYQMIKGTKYPTTAYQNTVVGILLNPTEEHFANDNIRKAFAMDINRDDFASTLTEDQLPAAAIVPPSVKLDGVPYREQAGDSLAPAYNPEQARSLLEQGMAQLKKVNKNVSDLNSLTLLAPEEAALPVQKILQTWQKDLGVYMKTEILPQDEYQQRLKSGDYSCAVVTVSSSKDSPASILEQFETNSSSGYSCGLSSYDNALNQASKQTQLSEVTNAYLQAESLLLNSGGFIPIYYQQSYFITQNNIDGLFFDNANERLYFQNARKK